MLSSQLLTVGTPSTKRTRLSPTCTNSTPTNLQIPVVALFEEYSIPFPGFMDKKSCQCVVEDGMYIRNHDFNETVELVRLYF